MIARAARLFSGMAAGLALLGAMNAHARADELRPRVVLISVDGLRPDAISPEWAPHLSWLLDSGASPTTAINDLPSATLPNHTSMLTGLPASQHGVIENWNLPGHIARDTVFGFAAAAGKRSAFFAGKGKLEFLASPEAVETVVVNDDTPALADGVIEQLNSDGPDLIFAHLRDPDSTGHRANWMSQEYIDAVALVDEQIGRIIDAINANAPRPTYLIVTADHGGEGNNHFLNIPVNRTIPWVVYGPDTVRGRLESTFSTVDTTPTVLALLGIDKPESLPGDARMEIKLNGLASGMSPLVPAISAPCVVLIAPFAIVGFHLLRMCLPVRNR
ncbi:MAG: alkaline phosphatase family protein [Phycisphaerales bacterium]|nr:alkaline phosphatase family protein [Phycisphaerales bacterium]